MSIIDFIQLSLAAIIMLTGLFMTLLGMGSEIYKIKVVHPKSKRFLIILGIPALITGLLLSVLLVWKEVFDVIPKLPKQGDFAWLFTPTLVVAYLLVLVIGLVTYIVYWIVSEKAYRVDATFINSSEYRANIRVDHRGGKPFNCIVKLEEVVSVSRNGDRQTQEIDKLNPDGGFFQWEDKNWYNKIIKDYPRVVRVVGINEWNHYDRDKTHFVFYGATSPYLNGNQKYEITVSIYRLRGTKHIKMKSTKRILQINSSGLSWEAA